MSYSLSSDFILKDMLTQYVPASLTEQHFKERMLDLLESYGDTCFYRTLKHAHFTASAWVIDESAEKALLTHHRKLGKWLQVGGHADGDTHLLRVASKELNEESGLAEFKLEKSEIFDIDIHLIPERAGEPAHEHFDVRFLFSADENEVLRPNHESKEMRWIPWEELSLITDNASIHRMNEKVMKAQKAVEKEN